MWLQTSYTAFPSILPMKLKRFKWFSWTNDVGEGYKRSSSPPLVNWKLKSKYKPEVTTSGRNQSGLDRLYRNLPVRLGLQEFFASEFDSDST